MLLCKIVYENTRGQKPGGVNNLKRKLLFTLIIGMILIFVSCKNKPQKIEANPDVQVPTGKEVSLNIVTTNKLLYYMVKDIVRDRNSVDYMFTSKDRLWNFTYSDDSLNNVSKKDLFFYWGSGLAPWTGDFVDKLSKSKVGAVNISRGVKLISYDRIIKYNDVTMSDNPYFWLNIDDYKIALLNIKNAIQDKDSKNRDFYEENFSNSLKEVEVYQKKIKETSDKLKDITFIVDGDELDYFVKYYGLKTLKVYNSDAILTKEDIDINEKVEQKIQGNQNLVFLYNDENKLKANKDLISKYNIKTSSIIVYKDDIKYLDMLDNNLKSLSNLLPSNNS